MLWCVLLIGLLCGSSCAEHQGADLAVRPPAYVDPQSPQTNQMVLLTIVVENRSGDYSAATSLAVRVDGMVVVTVPIDPVADGASRQLVTSFSCGQPGAHSVALVIDPDQATEDPDRNNNVFVFSLLVTGSGAG